MATEIERKFLVTDDSWRSHCHKAIRIVQGYLANTERGSIRVRISDDNAQLNIKSMTLGISRSEFEYPIPVEDANLMLEKLCMQPLVEKTRHLLNYAGHHWEIDEFCGANAGLIVAELELEDTHEAFDSPPWLGKEVSDDPRYYNVCLIQQPYSSW